MLDSVFDTCADDRAIKSLTVLDVERVDDLLVRKEYLFVGDVEAGKSLDGLYTLLATCESRGINSFDYLTDVLGRVQDHPANAIGELLPGA